MKKLLTNPNLHIVIMLMLVMYSVAIANVIVTLLLVLFVVFVPPKYDPAIRKKEMMKNVKK